MEWVQQMVKNGLPVDKLEQTIPERAARAVKVAYKKAIDSGRSVLIASKGELVRVTPDSKRVSVRTISKATKVSKGSRIKIK